MKLKRLGLGALALSLLFTSCGGKEEKKQDELVAYPTKVLEKQEAALESVYPANIKGQQDIEIRPRIDGFIDAIHVDEGSVVRKGQSLFRINSPQAEQAYLTAQAGVTNAEATVKTAKLNVDRIRPLAEQNIVSQVQLKTVENAYESANAALKQANAVLAQAKETKSWTDVKSPVDGIIGAIPYRQGSLVNSANVLTTVANTSNVYVYFSVNEKDLINFLKETEGGNQAQKIKQMDAVNLILADGTIYPEKGKIETITGVVNTSTGSVNFRADFPNKEGLLRSGSSGKVSIPKVLKDVFVIPQKATFAQQDKKLVYKVQGDSVVQVIIDAVGMPDGKSYAVTGGLKQGDRIVVDNLATLKNNMKIKVK